MTLIIMFYQCNDFTIKKIFFSMFFKIIIIKIKLFYTCLYNMISLTSQVPDYAMTFVNGTSSK